jgi:hypothetical protein
MIKEKIAELRKLSTVDKVCFGGRALGLARAAPGLALLKG